MELRIANEMSIMDKLNILADAAKYVVDNIAQVIKTPREQVSKGFVFNDTFL